MDRLTRQGKAIKTAAAAEGDEATVHDVRVLDQIRVDILTDTLLTATPTLDLTGTVLAVDRYRPGPLLDRFLAARDIRCRFPGCRTPARRCDRDHAHEWAHGGRTEACDLACLGKRHHTPKTEKPWTPTQLPDGSIHWSTPLGCDATDPPERYVTFREDPDPPPRGAAPF
jgi:hypothetical protein